MLDEALGKTRFIAGDAYSVADITALVAIDFMRPARIQRPESLDESEPLVWRGVEPAERQGLRQRPPAAR